MPEQHPKSSIVRPGHGRLVARWSLGMTLAGIRYMLHRVPFYRRNRRHLTDPTPPDFARALPGDPGTVQRVADGIGPVCHRRYQIAFTDARHSPEELMLALRDDMNVAVPVEVSQFEPLDPGGPRRLEVGDELMVRLPGPWNGPVRVVDITPTSLRLQTLDGHMEAGEIDFHVAWNERGHVTFGIESWARSGDELFNWLYHRLPIARELQAHMWSHFCERMVRIAGGVAMSNVELHTCTLDRDSCVDSDPVVDSDPTVDSDPVVDSDPSGQVKP